MKSTSFFILFWITVTISLAQVPQEFSYQAVVRDSEGKVMGSTNIAVIISLIKDSVDGPEIYTEVHSAKTNVLGLVTLRIGSGNSEDFAGIDWSDGPFYLKINVNGTEMGTTQLLSVPFALYSSYSANDFDGDYSKLVNVPQEFNPSAHSHFEINELEERIGALEDLLWEMGIGTVTDIDGNQYPVTKIGDQIWMAGNLRTAHFADGTPIPFVNNGPEWGSSYSWAAYCYYDDDSLSYADPYGVLYTWPAAMKEGFNSNENPSGVQGVCPDGWHLPSDEEWKELEIYLGMDVSVANDSGPRGTNEGSQLAGGSSIWNEGVLVSDSMFSETEFNGLPAGTRFQYGEFNGVIGYTTGWWTTAARTPTTAWARILEYSDSRIFRKSSSFNTGLSVRCVKDSP